MEAKKELEVDHMSIITPTTGTSFSQLLFGDDDDHHHHHHSLATDLPVDHHHHSFNLFSNTPKMLSFSNHPNQNQLVTPHNKSLIITSTHSSSSTTISTLNSISSSNSLQKKRNGSGQETVTKAGVGVGGQSQPKKTKAENPSSSTGHAKRKEKLGVRIAALQQLVSPFGKTDTASVLHEATGYIRFLHDQVQVLCSPYLQHHPGEGDNYNNGNEVIKDLKSRGLCLIPVGSTLHVTSTNGADFWSSPSIPNNNIEQ